MARLSSPAAYRAISEPDRKEKAVHPVNGEVPPVKGRPRKLPHYANRGKTSSSGGELASARSCFSTVRTALGKLRITGLLAQFDIARSFPQFPRPLLLQPTILTSERGTRFGIRKAPNHVPPPHLPDDPKKRILIVKGAENENPKFHQCNYLGCPAHHFPSGRSGSRPMGETGVATRLL